jgi:hypothetical protein
MPVKEEGNGSIKSLRLLLLLAASSFGFLNPPPDALPNRPPPPTSDESEWRKIFKKIRLMQIKTRRRDNSQVENKRGENRSEERGMLILKTQQGG